jgi:hypothetical protein
MLNWTRDGISVWRNWCEGTMGNVESGGINAEYKSLTSSRLLLQHLVDVVLWRPETIQVGS